MSRVDLYPTQSSPPSAAKIQTGSTVSGDKVAADTVVLNTVDGDVAIKGLSEAAQVSRITLTNTQWTRLPTTALTDRRTIMIQNQSGNGSTILLNFTNTAAANLGFKVLDGGHREILLSSSIIIYGRILAPGNVGTALVEELA